MSWTSNNGIVLHDLVPHALRRQWVREGHCPDLDVYTAFRQQVKARPCRIAVSDELGCLDYVDLDREVRRIATALRAAGLGQRDIIGIQLPNGRHAVAAELAVAALGAVSLPYPYGRGTRDSVSLLGRSLAAALITVARPELPTLCPVFVFGPAPEGCMSLDEAPVPPEPWTPAVIDPDGPARILVTSGSEAQPKMIAYSHNAFLGGRARYVRSLHTGEGPMRNLVLVPLSSSYGSLGVPVTLAALGGTLITQPKFDPADALRLITEQRPTHLFGVPTMLRRIVGQPRQSPEDTSSLRAVVSSSAAFPPSLLTDCRKRLADNVITVYGSADGVNCHTARTGISPTTGTGLPDPAVAQLQILSPTGRPLPRGEEGEIIALGPMTPLCYVADPGLDATYRLDGWVRTGDLGQLDRDGCLHVSGRLKQIVNRGGLNISPAEVEAHLSTHPDIADVACVPVPDPELGERLAACLVQHPSTEPLTLAALTGYLERERGLERRKLPEVLVPLAELPLGPTGKVCRHTLSALAADRPAPPPPRQPQGEPARR
ncbi:MULTISPECIES: fatty acid--CoA ligase family protein [unclassified Crossiella]|uniref:class I adenylate-forming enzyme family protein n=1 Tax=unclassified Crossiella TaxID=2620835 RepID=UPI001FFF5B9C|nr:MULTISPECIES: fatty acid--CoA ligase family protein [unclassified Crossiella]MCK2241550.1 fatty acid--CoA ligase family protein [Crossiella sp. S99.2]MCK2255578.1 fatty acid--CoA ligase family protein [Crossiella sp. S99.1]